MQRGQGGARERGIETNHQVEVGARRNYEKAEIMTTQNTEKSKSK